MPCRWVTGLYRQEEELVRSNGRGPEVDRVPQDASAGIAVPVQIGCTACMRMSVLKPAVPGE